MIPGDLPCKAVCHNPCCHYNRFGYCEDNYICERRMDAFDEPDERIDWEEEDN